MKNNKKSEPALVIDIIITASGVISALCFMLYYGNILAKTPVLWIGIAAFVIFYQLFFRIFMGKITKHIKINRQSFWFKEKPFEKKLYRFLRVRTWKDKVSTYDPDAFSREKHGWDEIASAMTKAELDHWINELISLFGMSFSLLWGKSYLFITVSLAAMLFDAQYIVLQRFHRPKAEKIINAEKRKLKPDTLRNDNILSEKGAF